MNSNNAISNDNLTNYRDDQGTTGFAPAVEFVYDAEAKEIDFTDRSVFPSAYAHEKTIVRVHDKFGGEVRATIASGSGSGSGVQGEETVDVSSLNRSKPFDITVTVLADDGKTVADGSAHDIGAAGDIGSWDIQKNA
jgi:hypothetical protein